MGTKIHANHGRDHLPWGADPIPGLGGATSSAYLADLLANGSGASVADDTWEEVATAVDEANSRWFDEANADPGGDWMIDFDEGAIGNAAGVAYNYAAWGFVVFDVPDGTLIGAAINLVAQEQQANTCVTVDGLSRVEVSAEYTPIPAGGVTLRCYQASGGAADILEARLHVRRFEVYQDVYEQTFAT